MAAVNTRVRAMSPARPAKAATSPCRPAA